MNIDDRIIQEYEDLKAIYKKEVVDKFDSNDFYNYLEDLFTAHSCAIEGNSFSVNETRELREKGLNLKLFDKSLFEAFEILDHFNAYEKAMSNLDKPLTEEFIKDLHFILTKNTIKYKTKSEPGEYTTVDMMAGTTIFGNHQENIKAVPQLLKETEDILDKNNIHPLTISAIFHKFFIYLHPFRDGNGRLGRLLSNFILAKKNEPIVIITAEKKQKYIEALTVSHKHKDFTPIIHFFFETSMERMKKEIEEKRKNNEINTENIFPNN